MTVTPAAASNGTSAVPTPPVAPTTSAVPPAFGCAVRINARAVSPVVASAAASATLRLGGRCASNGVSASKTAYSASDPVLSDGLVAPAIALSTHGTACPKISSPDRNAVTPGPVSTTVPAKSLPGTCGNSSGVTSRYAPPGRTTSAGLIEAAAMRTRSRPGPGLGTGTSPTT